jgi:DNA-binding response OmpR family regulator
MKILIAEDEKPLAHALELKLTTAGHTVIVANDGVTADELLKEGGYNLLLLDLIMPLADGFSVLENMKKRDDKTPVVIMSNLSQEEDKNKVSSYGVELFVIKSDTSLSEIVDRIETDFVSKEHTEA